MAAPGRNSLIDRVDDSDRPVGVIERGRVFDEKANFRVVHIFVFRSTGELLVQRLGLERDRHPGLWGSSVAGYLHQGETYEAAARRRLKEELELETPLVKQGETWMVDRGCRKFIHLYVTRAEAASIGDPAHIDAVEFWDVDHIEHEMTSQPNAFTETFRHVFGFYLRSPSLVS